jgi:hypothetical protein
MRHEKPTQPAKWRSVPDFPGYEVSAIGRVRHGDRLLKPDIDARGRRRFTLCRNGKAIKRLAGRIVLHAFVGPCPTGMECCHNNGDETDNRLENLRWDTHAANLADRHRHGTHIEGERIHTAKLTVANVREIRRIGKPLRQHATRFSVTESLVSAILKRKVWRHV